jgi:hypothetical protein
MVIDIMTKTSIDGSTTLEVVHFKKIQELFKQWKIIFVNIFQQICYLFGSMQFVFIICHQYSVLICEYKYSLSVQIFTVARSPFLQALCKYDILFFIMILASLWLQYSEQWVWDLRLFLKFSDALKQWMYGYKIYQMDFVFKCFPSLFESQNIGLCFAAWKNLYFLMLECNAHNYDS